MLAAWLVAVGGADTIFFEHAQPFTRLFDALPSQVVLGVAPAHDGRLWVLTDAGLVLFDGVRVEAMVVPAPNSANYERLHVDVAGRPWVSAYGSAQVFGLGEVLSPPDTRDVTAITSRNEAGTTALYVGSSSGLFRYVEGKFSRVLPDGVRALVVIDGEVWCAIDHALVVLGERPRRIPIAHRVFALHWRRGSPWIATEEGLFTLEGETTANGAPLKFVTGVAELDEGELWVVSDLGEMWQRERGRFRRLNPLGAAVINALAVTPGPFVWLATDRGLAQVLPTQWRTIDPGLSRTPVRRFAEQGETFVLAADNVLLADGNSLRFIDVGDDRVNALAAAHGAVWAGTKAGALWKLTPKPRRAAFTAGDSIFAIAPLAAPQLLLAQRFGVGIFDGAAVVPRLRTQRLFATAGGYVGGEDGLFAATGDARVDLPVTAQVLSLAQTDALWVGTAGEGLWRYAQGSFAQVGPLPNGFIDALVTDVHGRVWVCTEKGVVRLGEEPALHFTRGNGLPSDACVHGGMFADAQGRIWIATNAGAAVLDPKRLQLPPAPTLRIHTISQGGVAVTSDAWRRLAHDEASLAFTFSAPTFLRAEDVRYRSQLVGLERAPTPWSEQTRREFPTLGPGAYTFQAWSVDAFGRQSTAVSERFVVLPPWWRTWAAYIAYTLAIIALTALAARLRIQRLSKHAEALEGLVRQRTAELAAQKDALEQSHRQADRIFAALKDALKGNLIDDSYRLDAEIGKGGFGVVFRATHVRTGAAVAVKLFRPTPGNDSPEAFERFKLEIASGKRFRHPHAARVLDGGISKDHVAYMVMELLHGHSLRAAETLAWPRARTIALQVLDVLAAAHAQGIVHRDIKPDNVFLHHDGDGEIVKLLDFGVAKITQPLDGVSLRTLTLTGNVVGTTRYMAPERIDGLAYDGKADVYSLAVMLYEVLVRRLPFDLASSQTLAVALAHLQETPRPITAFDPSLPQTLSDALLACLAKDPSRRPDALEAAALLQAVP